MVTAVRAEAEAYEGGTGSVGVLVLHGFSGSTAAVRPWAQHLEQAGFSVSMPRLPGHGTRWQDLNLTGWEDWYAEADRAYRVLAARTRTVCVAGLSLGGALGLALAEDRGPGVASLALVNPVIEVRHLLMPALPLLQRLVPAFPGITNDIAMPGQEEYGYSRLPLRALYSATRAWRQLVGRLAEVRQPLLVYRSLTDHVAGPSSVELIRRGASSPDQTYVELTRSYHVATLDYEADTIFAGSVEFFRRTAGDGHDGTR